MSEFQLLIDGQLVDGDRMSNVINPSTEAVVAKSPRASAAQLSAAVAAAKRAFPAWSSSSMDTRRQALVAAADVIEANATMLGRLLTQEQGKPLSAAIEEVAHTAAFFRYFATLDLPVELIAEDATRRVEAHFKALGVVGLIVPWNYPLVLLAFSLPAALLAGNTVVAKPAGTTPLATLALGRLLAPVFPAGVLNVIADDNDLGDELTGHPDVAKICFTGSTATGRKVLLRAADTFKRITLEMGGNDAAIVLDDVDVQDIAPKLFASAFANSGQVCIAVKRLYVHDEVYDAMCAALATLADAATVGDGFSEDAQFGPLQNRKQYERVKDLLEDGRANGKVIAGGTLPEGTGYFIRPTIVRDIADGTRLVDEEQFGPVLPVIRFTDTDDVVARINAGPHALGGSVWSSDLGRACAVAERIDCGTVWVNKHLDLSPDVPFGGARHSGMGSELGKDGLREFTQRRIINIATH